MKKLKFVIAAIFLLAAVISCDKNDKNLPGFNINSDIESSVELCNTWVEETAWACGEEFDLTGNWSTYIDFWYFRNAYYNNWERNDFSHHIIAGRDKMIAGVVNFSYPEIITSDSEIKVVIKLDEGWRFQDVPENLKAHGFNVLPKKNFPVGKFDYKFDVENTTPNVFTFYMPVNNFIAIHLDVERWVECE